MSEVGADFFRPCYFSLNKGHWLNTLELQEPLRVSRGLVCFRVVEFCSSRRQVGSLNFSDITT